MKVIQQFIHKLQSLTHSSSSKSSSLKKYRLLISLVIVLFAITAALLALNVWSNHQMLSYARVMETAARQDVLIQQMAKDVMDVDLHLRVAEKEIKDASVAHGTSRGNVSAATAEAASDAVRIAALPANTSRQILEIQRLAMQFEQALNAFEHGGVLLTAQGTQVNIPAMHPQTTEPIRKIWSNYHRQIGVLMIDYQAGKVRPSNVHALVQYTRNYNQSLLEKGNSLVFTLYNDINQQVNRWQTWQLGGMVCCIILFGWIMLGALRQLMNHDARLERENTELSEIMSAIREGLFLVEKNFTIGKQHSALLEEMLGQKDIKGKNFLDVLAPMLPESELVNTQMFIEQLYNPWVVEDLIEDLNPLHRIVVLPENSSQPRYLDFKFFRVFKDGQVERIVVSVVDSTESVILASSLQAQEEQQEREMEMLNSILNVDARLLANFIHNSRERLDEINEVLQSPEAGFNELRAKVNFIGRNIHALKGESSALNLTRMVNICGTLEDSLDTLRRQTSLNGTDFFTVIVLLEDLYRLLDILDDYNRRLEQPNGALPIESDATQVEIQQMQNFVQDLAARNGKKASLTMHGFYQHAMDDAQRQSLQHIVLQLLRNSVVHGVEYPAVRRQLNKSEVGSLKLVLSAAADGMLSLTAEDDGNGIDFDAIRSKAVAEGRYTVEQVGHLSKKQLLSLMLSDGFSTAAQVTEDAGKGIGMGVIRQAVNKMGGKLNINTVHHQYTRFTITFPPKQP